MKQPKTQFAVTEIFHSGEERARKERLGAIMEEYLTRAAADAPERRRLPPENKNA